MTQFFDARDHGIVDHDRTQRAPAMRGGSPAPGGKSALWRAGAAAAVSLVAAISLWLAYRTMVGTPLGQHIDDAVLRRASRTPASATAQLTDALGRVSLASLVLAVIAITAVAAMRRRVDLAVAALVLVAGANMTTQALKRGLDRPDLGWGTLNSFPSGHVTVVASVAVAALMVSPLWLRGLLVLPAVAAVGLTAVATVVAGWHRPSDVVGAVLVAVVWWGLATSALTLSAARVRPSSGRPVAR